MRRTTEEFIIEAKKVHGDRYDYSEAKYTLKDNKLDIICSIHGLFSQSANNHLRGSGCSECADEERASRRRYTHKEFESKVKILHPSIEVIGKYSKSKDKILISINFGICEVIAGALLRGHTPTIETAIDKNTYYINQARSVHGDVYDYTELEYVKNNIKVKILCRIHGLFEQDPSAHLLGQGCPVCGTIYSNMSQDSVDVAVLQEAKFVPFSTYVLRLKSNDEVFYKIGITNEIAKRCRAIHNESKQTYNIEILAEHKTNLYDAVRLESELHKKIKKYRPKIHFGGFTECTLDNPIKLFTEYKNINHEI